MATDKPEVIPNIPSPLLDTPTIPCRLRYFSENYPDVEIAVFHSHSRRLGYTWRQIYDLSGRFARRLREFGFVKDDVIINCLPNSPERFITDMGIVFAGCVPMNGQVSGWVDEGVSG